MNFMSWYHSILVMSFVILSRLNLITWDIGILYSFFKNIALLLLRR